MNYYPFHIGDYVAATRHLSWDEDAAYRRLLDIYYTTEKPLANDFRALCRLVIAQTKGQKVALQAVLDEFFELTEAGWVNRRADAELVSMRERQTTSENRKSHEDERVRRYRERRAAMFTALRQQDIVPAWDVPMRELQKLFDTKCTCNVTGNVTVTDQQRSGNGDEAITRNGPATAIPTPTPTPTENQKTSQSIKSLVGKPTRDFLVGAPPGFIAFWKRWPSGPRKAAGAKCLDIWQKKHCEEEAQLILAHIEAMKMTSDWQKGFVTAPCVYLKDGKWIGAEPKIAAT